VGGYQQAISSLAEFFQRNIIVIFFFYGLAFFAMGLVVWFESNRSSGFRIARAMKLLAGFGIIHGLHEWFEMFQNLAQSGATNIPEWLLLDQIRIPHLVVSFILLIVFGVRLIYANRLDGTNENLFSLFSAGILFIIWLMSAIATRLVFDPPQVEFITAVDVLSRYILGIPGAILAAWAIFLEERSFRMQGMSRFGRNLLWAAVALILYGAVGQIFTAESFLFPANLINSTLFIRLFGIPIQLFRAIMATLMALFILRALRAFEVEQQRRLSAANEARLAAQQKALVVQREARTETEQLNRELQAAYQQLQLREARRADLLRQVVSAQEQERQRIARELHDGTGQILTGLGLGLAAAETNIPQDQDLAVNQVHELRTLNAKALGELRDIISDLRPSVLDDMGLVPAIKSQLTTFEKRTGLPVKMTINGHRQRLAPEIETIIFRITQEALTNVAKHAQASEVQLELNFQPDELCLQVYDNGVGFDPQLVLKDSAPRHAWGLIGMQERVALAGGRCEIQSRPGKGTHIRVTVPLAELEAVLQDPALVPAEKT